jgi:hypothetical protein
VKLWSTVLSHLVSGALIAGSFSLSVPPLEAQEGGQPSASAGTMAYREARADTLPDSPGSVRSSQAVPSDSQGTNSPQSSSSSSAEAQSAQPQSQIAGPPQKPVGTAAAESSNAGGTAASQPAGVAIAPAKQHRVRTIVIRVGAVAAAAVAVGTVAALSRATPSRPPGAH